MLPSLIVALAVVWGTPVWAATPTTGAASAITASGVTLNGVIDSTGTAYDTPVAFEYGLTTTYTNTAITTPRIVAGNSAAAAVSATVGGLACNTTYHYRLNASSVTNGPAAAQGADQTFVTAACAVPGQPSVSAVTAGDTKAIVTFTPPGSDGGTAITGYTVATSPAGGVDADAGSTSTSHLITGLTNGQAYTFTVVASNGQGAGSASAASVSATPDAAALGVTGVTVTSLDITASPTAAQIVIPMTHGSLNASAFSIANNTTPATTATITGASYASGKYTLSVTGMTVADTYTLSISAPGYSTYTNSSVTYGVPATAADVNLVDEPNIFTTYTRTLTEPGTVTIGNTTYAKDAVLYSGAQYTKVDGNNGNPDNGTAVRLIGIFGIAPAGAKCVKTLRTNGSILQVAADSIIDANPNYMEVVQGAAGNGTYYYNTVLFLPMYAQNATARQGDNSRILTPSADRFRIIEWYNSVDGSGNCTGTPSKVLRLWVKVAYTGNIIKESTTELPVISTQPSDKSVYIGDSAGLSVAATVGAGTLSYQWYSNTTNSNRGGALIGGATSAAYSAPTTTLGTVYYYVEVTNSNAGNVSALVSSAAAVTVSNAPPAAPSVPSNTTTLPTGGGTAAPGSGQSVIVTDNGNNGSTIILPPPTGNDGNRGAINVQLPNNGGTINVQNNSSGTQLGVQSVTLPGSATPVTAVTVNQGSATFTASGAGQPLAGLKNGIIVVSGASNSQVTVDTTGGAPQIGVTNSDTIIVPQGTPNVAGTVVNLPSPTGSGGVATPVIVQTGAQTLSVQSTGSGSTISFATTNLGGATTPVVTVSSGSATVTSSGNGQPLVAMGGGNTVITAGSGTGSGNRCNTVTEVTTGANRDIVQVNTCYIVVGSGATVRPGAYIPPPPANAFAEVKDGIVWAGETADFDKDGKLTAVYLGTKGGVSSAVGDDSVPGGNKFTAAYTNAAFIPRLKGQAKRLNDADFDTSLYAVVNRAFNTSLLPATPSQTTQGILTFQVAGGSDAEQKAQATLSFDLKGDQVNVFPSRRIRVDTSRADGVKVSTEGNVEVAVGGLVTTFVPTVADPQGFAADIAKTLPAATAEMRWNGSWKVVSADGRMFIGRPQWGSQVTASRNGFAALADGAVMYNANGRAQVLFPDFHDYTTLLATFSKEFNDPNLKVAPRMNGSVQATLNGSTYLLYPQWTLIPASQITGKLSWWLDNGVVYIKNADGTAQGFGVK